MKNDRSSAGASGRASTGAHEALAPLALRSTFFALSTRYRSLRRRASVVTGALGRSAAIASMASLVVAAAPTPAFAQAASTPLIVKAATPASGAAVAKAPMPAAEPAASPAALAAANQLMTLQEDTVILKAQLKKLEAQADVAARQDALGRMGHVVNPDTLGVVATESLGNTMMATVNVSDGSELDVRAGDQLPNGIRIVSIHPGVVVVDSNGRRSTLTVSSPRSRDSRMVAINGNSSGVPPIPSIPSYPMPAR
jgi:type IV pilus biogenesis protein PilP